MIQAINSVSTNSYKKQNTSFKQQEIQEQIGTIYKQPSKTKRVITFLGKEFVAGVVVSTILDLTYNVFRAIKNKRISKKILENANNPELGKKLAENIKSLITPKKMLKNASIWGGIMMLASAVFAGIDTVMQNKKAKNINPMV